MGRFPKTSSNGSKYIMAAYIEDSNGILTRCLKNRNNNKLTKAFSSIYFFLVRHGLTLTVSFLDNEYPPGLAVFMCTENITYQLVAPHNHRSNPAEKAIGTWKDHFIADLSSVSPNFPLHL